MTSIESSDVCGVGGVGGIRGIDGILRVKAPTCTRLE